MLSPRALQRCAQLAAELFHDGDSVALFGIPVALEALLRAAWPAGTFVVSSGEQIEAMTHGRVSLCLASGRVATDGSLAAAAGTLVVAEQAQAAQVPFYVLAPAGPDPAAAHADALQSPGDEIVPAALIAAILTSRGIYRPAMITRHLSDGNAPLDVIALRG